MRHWRCPMGGVHDLTQAEAVRAFGGARAGFIMPRAFDGATYHGRSSDRADF